MLSKEEALKKLEEIRAVMEKEGLIILSEPKIEKEKSEEIIDIDELSKNK